MAFVASFFAERKSLESFELTSDDEESQQNNDAGTEIQNHHFHNEINNTVAIDIAAAENITVTEIQNEDDIIVSNKSSQPPLSQAKKSKTIKRAKIQPPQSASAVLMSKLLEAQNKSTREHDELDRFFLHISDTVKKFSPYLQVMAKNEIFSLISEMDLQQLAPPNFVTVTPQYTSSPASTSASEKASATPMPPSPEAWNFGTLTSGIIIIKLKMFFTSNKLLLIMFS